MARATSHNPAKTSTISNATTVARTVKSTHRATTENGEPESPIHSAISTIFENDTSVQEGITTHLRERSSESQTINDRAQAAFVNFSPSKYSSAERARLTYLAPGDDLARSMKSVTTNGVDAIRASTASRSIRLRLNEQLKTLIRHKKGNGDSLLGTIDLDDLVHHVTLKPDPRPSLLGDAAFSSCKAELEAERRLKEIQGLSGSEEASEAGGPADATGEKIASTAEHSTAEDLTTAKLVKDNVDLQMETATSPESQLLFSVPKRSDQTTRAKSIQTFELRAGPSDVTSYHDFRSLQIAFEHIWTEIFDGQLGSLGQELYHEYIKLKVFTGVDDGRDRKISTLDDLSLLMADIRGLSRDTQDNIPRDLQGGGDSSTDTVPTSPKDVFDRVKTVLDPFSLITAGIGDETVRAVLNPAGAVIDAIGKVLAGKQNLNWGSFPGPLPIGNDIITTSFEEDAAAPGTVEIVLKNSKDAWWWKGIEFRELDAAGNIVSDFKISNDPRDTDVWDQASYNVLPLYTPQLKNGLLEFKKAAMVGVHTGFYLLAGLDEKITDRTRVTFTWEKDS